MEDSADKPAAPIFTQKGYSDGLFSLLEYNYVPGN